MLSHPRHCWARALAVIPVTFSYLKIHVFEKLQWCSQKPTFKRPRGCDDRILCHSRYVRGNILVLAYSHISTMEKSFLY